MRLDVSIKGAFSVLPPDYLVACARLSVSVDNRTNHASNEITNERKTAGRQTGKPFSKQLFKSAHFLKNRFSCQMSKLMSKRQKVQCKVSTSLLGSKPAANQLS